MFLGVYDTVPTDKDPNMYELQRDYGFLRDDGLLIIGAKGVYVNGANIPRWAWVMVGSPLRGMNKYWSAPHDFLYAKHAIILDTTVVKGNVCENFKHWRELPSDCFRHQTCFNKKFADNTLLQAMTFLEEPWIKRKVCYASVRVGGTGWWGGVIDT